MTSLDVLDARLKNYAGVGREEKRDDGQDAFPQTLSDINGNDSLTIHHYFWGQVRLTMMHYSSHIFRTDYFVLDVLATLQSFCKQKVIFNSRLFISAEKEKLKREVFARGTN